MPQATPFAAIGPYAHYDGAGSGTNLGPCARPGLATALANMPSRIAHPQTRAQAMARFWNDYSYEVAMAYDVTHVIGSTSFNFQLSGGPAGYAFPVEPSSRVCGRPDMAITRNSNNEPDQLPDFGSQFVLEKRTDGGAPEARLNELTIAWRQANGIYWDTSVAEQGADWAFVYDNAPASDAAIPYEFYHYGDPSGGYNDTSQIILVPDSLADWYEFTYQAGGNWWRVSVTVTIDGVAHPFSMMYLKPFNWSSSTLHSFSCSITTAYYTYPP